MRYSGIVNPQTLIDSSVMIVGVGAIGRQVALQLASMGVGRILLHDMDTVEEVNLGPQGYRPDQIGMPKVEATKADIIAINPDCSVFAFNKKFERHGIGVKQMAAVFSCVDCMDARRNIMIGEGTMIPKTAIDTRMSAFSIQCFHVTDDEEQRRMYNSTLFSNDQAHPEPCTARSTMFTASIAAGLAVAQWVQGLKAPVPLPFAQLLLDAWVLEEVPLSPPPETEPSGDAAPEEPQTETSAPSETSPPTYSSSDPHRNQHTSRETPPPSEPQNTSPPSTPDPESSEAQTYVAQGSVSQMLVAPRLIPEGQLVSLMHEEFVSPRPAVWRGADLYTGNTPPTGPSA